MACSTASWPRSRCHASDPDRAHRPARTVVRSADCAITLASNIFRRAAGGAGGAVLADVGLAASPVSAARTRRLPNGSVRLGEPVNVGLLIHNGGRRRFRGQVRDAWPPSARAEPRSPCRRHRRRAGPAGRTPACGRSAAAISGRQRSLRARSARWGWRGGRGRARCPARSGCCRRSCPASTCRRAWPDSGRSTGCCRP